MARQASNFPSIEPPSSAEPQGLFRYLVSASQRTTKFLYELAQRANACLPEDGSERMTGPLPVAIYTTAGLPSASTYGESVVFDSTANILKYSDGSTWKAIGNPLNTALTDTHIFVGNSSNIAADVAMSGDATISDTGVVTVAKSAKLTTARTIAITGDLSWSVSFDGSANVTAAGTLANSGVTAATYGDANSWPIVTFNAKGLATSASTQSFPTATTIIAGATADITPGSSYTDVTGSAVTLSAGTWLVVAQISCTFTSAISSCYARLFNSTDSTNINAIAVSANDGGFFYSMPLFGFITVASGTKVVKLQCKHDSTGSWTINHTIDGGIASTGIAAIKLSN
jgi:hypothetical protein